MQKFIYPQQDSNPKVHQNIVNSLLKGCFITLAVGNYEFILKYKKWYEEFFKYSFNVELKYEYEVFYLVSDNDASSFTKRILTTIAILMYELNNKGFEAVKEIRESIFEIDKVNSYISQSVQFSSLFDKNKVDNNFINKLQKLGLVKRFDENRFMFTEAIEVFLNEYDNIRYEINLISK